MERLLGWFVDHQIAGPDEESLASLIVTARRTFEDKVLETIASFLSSEHRRRLDASLADEDSATSFSGLKADPDQPNLDNILIAARRLAFVKQLALPGAAFPDLSGPVVRMLRHRVLNETAWTMRRHPDGRRHALYALFLTHRERELTDGLAARSHASGEWPCVHRDNRPTPVEPRDGDEPPWRTPMDRIEFEAGLRREDYRVVNSSLRPNTAAPNQCPGCWLETYGLEEGRCAVCGFEMPADAECAVYGQPLTTEEYRYNNSLCGHHKITY